MADTVNINHAQWHQAIPMSGIGQDEVHVWRASLDVSPLDHKKFLSTLSNQERKCAMRFRFERDTKRFVAAHGILRNILASYTGTQPEALHFIFNNYGKPAITDTMDGVTLRFNMSHSGLCALYAFTLVRNIGVDIEHIRKDIGVDLIAERFFTRAEILALRAVDQGERPRLFFQFWTRKESFIKAIGLGVSYSMEQFDVSRMQGHVLSPVLVQDEHVENGCWYGRDLFPGGGYCAAVVVEDGDCNFRFLEYDASLPLRKHS